MSKYKNVRLNCQDVLLRKTARNQVRFSFFHSVNNNANYQPYFQNMKRIILKTFLEFTRIKVLIFISININQ